MSVKARIHIADRKNKRHLCTGARGSRTRRRAPAPGLGRRRAAPAGAGHAPPDGGGEDREGRRGQSGSGKAAGGEGWHNGLQTLRGVALARDIPLLHTCRPRDRARRRGQRGVLPIALMRVLCHPGENFLARTGRSNGRWDRRELHVPQDPRDHRLVGDGGKEPERAMLTEWARGHIQVKYPLQQPRQAPARRPVRASSLSAPCCVASG